MGVAVGSVGVNVGMFEAVTVGAVDVGKGPRSAPAVNAMAVLVLLAFRSASASLAGLLKEIQSMSIKAINRPEAPNACR